MCTGLVLFSLLFPCGPHQSAFPAHLQCIFLFSVSLFQEFFRLFPLTCVFSASLHLHHTPSIVLFVFKPVCSLPSLSLCPFLLPCFTLSSSSVCQRLPVVCSLFFAPCIFTSLYFSFCFATFGIYSSWFCRLYFVVFQLVIKACFLFFILSAS